MLSQFPELESERLQLKSFKAEDMLDIFELYSNEEVVQYYDIDAMKDVDEAKDIINLFIHRFDKNIGIRWVISLKETGEFIGDIGFNVFDREIRSADIGYAINSKQWNKGYATEALRLVLDFGFYNLKIIPLNRIEARVMDGNNASRHLLEKLGFMYEGNLRDTISKNERLYDTHIYSILKNQYIKN